MIRTLNSGQSGPSTASMGRTQLTSSTVSDSDLNLKQIEVKCHVQNAEFILSLYLSSDHRMHLSSDYYAFAELCFNFCA